MRAVEFIRGLLDLLDTLEEPEVRTGVDSPFTSVQALTKSCGHTDPCDCEVDYQNEPNEKYATIHAVTTQAGGGVNGPKNAADLRGNSVNIYPRGE